MRCIESLANVGSGLFCDELNEIFIRRMERRKWDYVSVNCKPHRSRNVEFICRSANRSANEFTGLPVSVYISRVIENKMCIAN